MFKQHVFGPCYAPDGDGGGSNGDGNAQAGAPAKDPAFYEAEAKKAFAERDKAKKELKALQDAGRILNDDQIARYKQLEEQAQQAEEDRKRKSGEFDQWRADILKKHQTEIQDREQKLTATEQKWQRTMVGLAFAGASDLFGKDAFTIYSPKAAERIFGEFVSLDADGQPVVKGRDGAVILDAQTGKPASFSIAMRELIESLPDKNDHLRGSGKTGSGSSGGASGGRPEFDLSKLSSLTAEQRRDPKVLAALRALGKGQGVVMGEAYNG